MPAPKKHVRGLIDTGAILALLNSADRWHAECAAAYSTLGMPLATTAAVLAETFHLIGRRDRLSENAWRLFTSDAVSVVPIDDADLPALEELMRKYADRPMDFADATLVHLAERESTNVIFTIDHNDFETYRVHNRPFDIKPSRTP